MYICSYVRGIINLLTRKGENMSSVLFFTSDFPLKERPNPHDKLVSVNEALKLGKTDIPDFLLSDDFDKDKPGVMLISDRNIDFDIDTGKITDGDFDDDFGIFVSDKPEEIKSTKKYFAFYEINRFTEGRGLETINYINENIKENSEIEFWHVWLGNDTTEAVVKKEMSLKDLKPDNLEEILYADVCREPIYDYCLVIKA